MSESVEILSKLFDTLKDASEKNEATTQKLVEQQIILVGKIKNMPMDELRDALKNHADKSADDFVSCSGIIELKTAEIKDLLKLIVGKINKIFLIVSVAVAIATSGYFVLRYLAEDHVSIDQLRQELRLERQEEQTELIKEIQKEMRKLHGKENGGPNK